MVQEVPSCCDYSTLFFYTYIVNIGTGYTLCGRNQYENHLILLHDEVDNSQSDSTTGMLERR